ncbi:MAG: hypothetical protein GYA12_00810, partial [Chloroflexi bacterium]|nr:hypothetical protein [Chloroflexota bacterium]
MFLKNSDKWQAAILWLGFLEGIAASVCLLFVPSDTGSILGLSPARFAILVAIMLPSASCLVLAITHKKKKAFLRIIRFFNKQPLLLMGAFILLSFLVFLIPVLLQDLYTGTNIFSYQAYSQRIKPLTTYTGLLLLQSAIWIMFTNLDVIKKELNIERKFFQIWGVSFIILLIFVGLIIISRFGLVHDPIGWGKPTVPLMEWQIWLGILLFVIFRLAENTSLFQYALIFIQKHHKFSNWIMTLTIWIAAFAIWSSIPVPPGFFATPPRAPNFEIYPFSDAAFYDFHAQSMLIGFGFRGDAIPPRPLYILFLAFAHILVGQEYTRVIMLQTALLAFLPVVVFWIGRKLANTQIGLVSSLYIIFREWTSIISTPFTSD